MIFYKEKTTQGSNARPAKSSRSSTLGTVVRTAPLATSSEAMDDSTTLQERVDRMLRLSFRADATDDVIVDSRKSGSNFLNN